MPVVHARSGKVQTMACACSPGLAPGPGCALHKVYGSRGFVRKNLVRSRVYGVERAPGLRGVQHTIEEER